MTTIAPAPEVVAALDRATEPDRPRPQRLLSLDVFRGAVIVAMLVVNNLGDHATTGYFWKHADWVDPWLDGAFAQWWHGLTSGALPWYAAFTRFPLFVHCTLADYVMPSFMLIIGLAIPLSVAAGRAKGITGSATWWRVVKRAFLLVLLGWILCYFRDQFARWLYADPPVPFRMSLGMDVLQLLGVSYLVARVLYELPKYPRIAALVGLFVWHWALLRFGPQGDVPAGTFTERHNAVGYAYRTWPLWDWTTLTLGPVTMGWRGMLSVPPAAATMLLGTLAGDWLRREDVAPRRRAVALAAWGAVLAAVGFVWALDLPFNKPRWTPAYLVWCAGVGFVALAGLYTLIDIHHRRGWTRPFVVFGANAIAAYWLSIMFKILVLNTPRVTYDEKQVSLTQATLLWLKDTLGSPWLGGWAFTFVFVGFWWLVLDQMYRRRVFWRL